jgi:hypothetical protein
MKHAKTGVSPLDTQVASAMANRYRGQTPGPHTTAGATVFCLYSHKSTIMQFQHCGLRATHV